jgi:hypothetical protein
MEGSSYIGISPTLDKNMVTLFVNTLNASYYEYVMGSSS